MGQRSKVLDTEGPTPKFLYAIIKQLNLKDIDWNRVASELEISNGHAARMRYSRFKSQIDPTSPRSNKKKNAKKGGKGDLLKENLQKPQTMPHPSFFESGVVPKLEPTESPFQPDPNPFRIKFERGTSNAYGMQGPSNSQEGSYSLFPPIMSPAPTITSPRMMPSPQMMPPRYVEQFEPVSYGPQPQQVAASAPLTLASGMYAPLPTSTPSGFATYPSFPMSHDFNMQAFSSQTPGFNNGPVITWEPVPQQKSDSPPSPARIKVEPESCENKIDSVDIKTEDVSADEICID